MGTRFWLKTSNFGSMRTALTESAANPTIAIQLFKGALRSFSGLIDGTDPGSFALGTSTTTIGIRGADFGVALAAQTLVVAAGADGATARSYRVRGWRNRCPHPPFEAAESGSHYRVLSVRLLPRSQEYGRQRRDNRHHRHRLIQAACGLNRLSFSIRIGLLIPYGLAYSNVTGN